MMGTSVRNPAVAGKFYPRSAAELDQVVAGLLTRASTRLQDVSGLPDAANRTAGTVRAVIAPHAGYMFSGSIAALSFAAAAQYRDAPPRRVILLGPAHYAAGITVALPQADSFRTPLGDHPVDGEAMQRLLQTGLAETNGAAHSAEHSLEVMLPFIMAVWGALPILPLLCSRIAPERLAEILVEEIGPGDLLVVSSDLSHFHPAATAEQLDNALLEAWEQGDPHGVSQGEACGKLPILASMALARQQGWRHRVLGYAHSGAAGIGSESVVGYGAGMYYASSE
ncbi:AmmeMemoRadiSam system protein B [Spirochaeta africana]|uniref:Putative dioxygenase n=1 Tax=Spirochaeta africana (strain ATCC 700263 / DSM 8902 / Z-7692) TaxID=889378 RepID=H9UFY4_SPIAZ|nr:AmmeMemoRadiSam system protein B [Spirochaeta africana]AFG36427.1 putative dioxygenase [Spirochaeta africana DSM 8902]